MRVEELLGVYLARFGASLNRLQRTVLMEIIRLVRQEELTVELVEHTEVLANSLEIWSRHDGDAMLQRCSLHYTKQPCPDEHMVISGLHKARILQVHVYNDVVEILHQLRNWGNRGVLSIKLERHFTRELGLTGNRISKRLAKLVPRHRRYVGRFIDYQIQLAELQSALDGALADRDVPRCREIHTQIRLVESRLETMDLRDVLSS